MIDDVQVLNRYSVVVLRHPLHSRQNTQSGLWRDASRLERSVEGLEIEVGDLSDGKDPQD